MRERHGGFVNGGVLQLALREWRALYLDRRALALVGIVGALVGLAGPFGTGEALPLAPRLAYWVAIASATFAVGSGLVALLPRLPPLVRLPAPAARIVAGLAAGPAIAAAVTLVNAVVFPDLPLGWGDAVRLAVECGLIAGGVTAAIGIAGGAPASAPAPGGPAILRRLPLERRGQLVRLAMQDHYVEVHTERGMHLVLMRLSDAIDEVEGVPGLRVHRSHWVALEAIAAARREEGRVTLVLRDGATVPVSRSHLAALREAGVIG